ncbi:MAG TPA: ATP-binding protein [Nitrospirota bacterium]|nr:ATP-binding protein [Nitrospirota bacterium]
MMSSATNFRTVIASILDLSEIEAGKMDVGTQRFDASLLVDDIAEMTRVLVGSKPVKVKVMSPSMPVMVISDPIKLRQIIMNLANNAVKFTERGEITITLAIIGSRLEIVINDTAPGIREEHREKLFTAFCQIEDAKTNTREGTGLGLTLSKKLAELIGGSISVTSIYGEGTAFTVSLPLQNIEHRGLYDVE